MNFMRDTDVIRRNTRVQSSKEIDKMDGYFYNEEGDLVVKNVLKRIAAGERRRDHLLSRLEDEEFLSKSSVSAINFMKGEILSWNAAIAALKHHHMSLQPETSPYSILRELLDSIDNLGMMGSSQEHINLHKAMARGRMVLDMAK